jgi:hypothetical protein
MISKKFSTNPESFIKFGRGRRIGWRLHMETPIYHSMYRETMYRNFFLENRQITKTGHCHCIAISFTIFEFLSVFYLYFVYTKT